MVVGAFFILLPSWFYINSLTEKIDVWFFATFFLLLSFIAISATIGVRVVISKNLIIKKDEMKRLRGDGKDETKNTRVY